MVQEAAKKLAGRAAVVQVNTDENPQLASRFNISGIPAVLILLRGKVAERSSGAMTESALLSWFNRHAG